MKIYSIEFNPTLTISAGYHLANDELGKRDVWINLGYKVPKKNSPVGTPLKPRKCKLTRDKSLIDQDLVLYAQCSAIDSPVTPNVRYLASIQELVEDDENDAVIVIIKSDDGHEHVRVENNYHLRNASQLMEGLHYAPESNVVPEPIPGKRAHTTSPCILVMQPYETYTLHYTDTEKHVQHTVTLCKSDGGIEVIEDKFKETQFKSHKFKTTPRFTDENHMKDKRPNRRHKDYPSTLGDIFNLKPHRQHKRDKRQQWIS